MKDISFQQYSNELLAQLPKGVFLAVQAGDKANLMTIGWGTIGVAWGKPILNVMVRYSRYTYELLDKTKEFTVSVPLKTPLQKELGLCGAKSGRDINKFAETGLSALQGRAVATPVVGECDLFYECKILYRQAMEPAVISVEIQDKFYRDHNYHVFFSGEIVACYIKE